MGFYAADYQEIRNGLSAGRLMILQSHIAAERYNRRTGRGGRPMAREDRPGGQQRANWSGKVREVRDALNHLHDPVDHLRKHSLTRLVQTGPEERGRALQKLLFDAIEA